MPIAGISDLISAAARRNGIPPQELLRFGELESSLNPNAISPTGAKGLFQFIPSTAKQYGLENPLDPVANADAAARLLRDNRAKLHSALGYDPAPWQTYLAHQQGAAGATALLSRPGENAVDALAPAYGGDRAAAARAIQVNGGSPNMTAGDFANLWKTRYTGQNGTVSTNAAPGIGQNVGAPPNLANAADKTSPLAGLSDKQRFGLGLALNAFKSQPQQDSAPLMPLTNTAAQAPQVTDTVESIMARLNAQEPGRYTSIPVSAG